VCKRRFVFELDNLPDAEAVQELKVALLNEWDEHLQKKHRRQWDSREAKHARYRIKE
jgi:hypothetical protein